MAVTIKENLETTKKKIDTSKKQLRSDLACK